MWFSLEGRPFLWEKYLLLFQNYYCFPSVPETGGNFSSNIPYQSFFPTEGEEKNVYKV